MKMEGTDEVSESFTYALIQNSSRLPADVHDWLPLSSKYIPQTHIHYHEVQSKTTGLQSVIATIESAAAVVVANTNDNTHLTPLMSPVSKIPVIVVASSAGQKLQKMICQGHGRVLCKIIPRMGSTLCRGLY